MGHKNGKKDKKTKEENYSEKDLLSKDFYEKELEKFQIELVKLQEWIKHQGLKVVVIFEGRDAAGKGGTIKRIIDKLNPRIVRLVALGVPTEKEKSQWYFQRYVAHLPAAGEMVLSIDHGITEPVLSALWDFVRRMNIVNFLDPVQNLKECLYAQE